MYCSHCGKEISQSAKFCTHCGAPLNDKPLSSEQVIAPAAGTTRTLPGKRRVAALCVLAVLLILCAVIGGRFLYRQVQVKNLCEEASTARQQWRVEDAALAWRQALALQPTCTDAYLGLSDLERLFSNTTNAILILNDGLSAGADSERINMALDSLCGPDIVESSLPQILSLENNSLLSRYSRSGNLLYTTDIAGMMPGSQYERMILPNEDVLRPSAFTRSDGTETCTYDALGLLSGQSFTGTEYTKKTVWVNSPQTGLPLSCTVRNDSISTEFYSEVSYEYAYSDGRLVTLTVIEKNSEDVSSTDAAKTVYQFQQADANGNVAVTIREGTVFGNAQIAEDYLAEFNGSGQLLEKQPYAYSFSDPVRAEYIYNSNGALEELYLSATPPASSALLGDSVSIKISYDENNHINAISVNDTPAEAVSFPAE